MSTLKEAVLEYIEARNELEDAQKPNGGFGQPTRLSHGDPRILRHRLARTNLNLAAGLCMCGVGNADKCPGMCGPKPVSRETLRPVAPAPQLPVFIFAGSAMQARKAASDFGLHPSQYVRVVGTESIAGARDGTMYLYGTYHEYPRAHEVIAAARHQGFEIRGRFPTVTYRFVGRHGSTGEEIDVERSFTDEPAPFTADSKASDWGYNYFDKGSYRISEVLRETH